MTTIQYRSGFYFPFQFYKLHWYLQNSLLEKQIQELNFQLEDDQRSYEAALNDRDAQIRKMREECQALMVELQMLLDTKQVSIMYVIYGKLKKKRSDVSTGTHF